jgi:uncharacterized protein with NAD-binding domain and iron-sulfur cluster
MRRRVAILGGGIAGLSAAHELIERGFSVDVFEHRSIAGGKARSFEAQDAVPFAPLDGASPRLPGRGLPVEHGFRFFPGFYRHVIDTMLRIPFRDRTVADNLTDTTRVQWAWFDRPSMLLPARFPQTSADLTNALETALGTIGGRAGVPIDETLSFGAKLFQILSSCDERRIQEYEQIDWWTFIEAPRRSLAYQQIYGHAFTRSLVAAKADRASTKTVGDIFVQMLLAILEPGESTDRLLNGPTNDVWLDPWVEYLTRRGVRYHYSSHLRALHCHDGAVSGAVIAQGSRTFEAHADQYVLAIPVERAVELLTPELVAADPALANLHQLARYVEWMNGIQFFLAEDVPIAPGHTIYVDSTWAITSVSQKQFWPDFDLSTYGRGDVRGILSVDISDFFAPGLNQKKAVDCTAAEIASEVWTQLKRSLNSDGRERLTDSNLRYWYLDSDLVPGSEGRPLSNAEPLLVNYVNTWRLRPEAVTRIPNLFLASDYVRTHTDLATMEAANEAARRAVNGILASVGATAEPCSVWNLQVPEAFAALRAQDLERLRRGQAWDGSLATAGSAALALAGCATGGSGGALPALPARTPPSKTRGLRILSARRAR